VEARLIAVAAALLTPLPALAAGCDLGAVVGYTLAHAKTISGFIENGQRTRGFEGCVPGRVLVFTDNTGVRCKGHSRQNIELPRAFLFAKSQTDLKLCVGDEMLEVAPAH
jgi:hypothetical protein